MPPLHFAVREAWSDDADVLAQLRWDFRAALGAPTEDEAGFVVRCAAWMRVRLAAGDAWRAWVATTSATTGAGRIVGTLWVERLEKMPNPTDEPEAHAYVTNAYVRPAYRGARIGEALLAAAMRWCESAGVHAAILWPTEQSVPLYARHGFHAPEALLEREFARGPARSLPRGAV